MIKEVKEDNKLYRGLELSNSPNNENEIVCDETKDYSDYFDFYGEYQEDKYPILEKVFKDYFETVDNEQNNIKNYIEKI